jgi:hypothetical protein
MQECQQEGPQGITRSEYALMIVIGEAVTSDDAIGVAKTDGCIVD